MPVRAGFPAFPAGDGKLYGASEQENRIGKVRLIGVTLVYRNNLHIKQTGFIRNTSGTPSSVFQLHRPRGDRNRKLGEAAHAGPWFGEHESEVQ